MQNIISNNIVYCHCNKINGKKYIGITKNTISRRVNNGIGYKKSSYFYNAIVKYGWESFETIILENNLTREEANDKERYYIHLYNTNDERYGYNLTNGGDNNFNRLPLNKAQKDNISQKTKKAMNRPDVRNRMLEVYSSEDWIAKNSIATKNQWDNTNLRQKIKESNGNRVRCLETGKEYYSILDASKDTGMSRWQITQSCKLGNSYKSVTKYHWSYI